MAYAPNTKSFSVDNVTGANIVAGVNCQRILVYETAQAGTTDYIITLASGAAINKAAGTIWEITAIPGARFDSGSVIGTIKTVAGTVTFVQEEY